MLIVLAGIIVGQSAIYGPCLIGRKILLPLDILAEPGSYLPRTEEVKKIERWDVTLSDQVYQFEPARRFAAAEFRAGRLPLWSPNYFAGAPCIWSVFSPFALLECLTESPVIVAWKALATALVAGLGMYWFCRRAVRVGFWPACICAWCYPVTGFLVAWQGFYARQTVCALPWLLLAVDETVRRKSRFAPIGLSLVTGLVAWQQLDIAGQVLLVSGVYALWCLWDEYRGKCFSSTARRVLARLTLAWLLGLLLATPQVLPTLEYSRAGSRMSKRAEGSEERPPAGVVALPHLFLPDYYGRSSRNTMPIIPYKPGNLQESAVGAYAGVLAMLFAAPLAFWSRRNRSISLFLAGLALLGVGWVLNIPIIVNALRAPGLNMMSHNRLVFVTSFAFLALAAVGLDLLLNGTVPSKKWRWLLASPLAGLSGFCIYRAIILPEPVATQIGRDISHGIKLRWVADMNGVHQVQQWFVCHSLVAGTFCATGVAFFLLLGLRKVWLARLFPVIGASLLAELLWFGQKWQAQCDPALYYPPVPALEQIARATPGRVIGYGALPANLASIIGLRDIRGYNGVDPAVMVELLNSTIDSRSATTMYSRTQMMAPKATFFSNGDFRLPAILDLLGVRYVIFTGPPSGNLRPVFQSFDYFVLENSNALSRVFIPRSVEVVPNPEERLTRLESSDFDPRQVAFVETAVELPSDCRGEVEIRNEIPTRVAAQARMDTAGLVVLADCWDIGWRAYLDGRVVPILKTDHALRGVVTPAGNHTIEFRYESDSFAWGMRFAGLAILTLVAWTAIAFKKDRQAPKPAETPQQPEPASPRTKPAKASR